jgi:hypothetical protein
MFWGNYGFHADSRRELGWGLRVSRGGGGGGGTMCQLLCNWGTLFVGLS